MTLDAMFIELINSIVFLSRLQMTLHKVVVVVASFH